MKSKSFYKILTVVYLSLVLLLFIASVGIFCVAYADGPSNPYGEVYVEQVKRLSSFDLNNQYAMALYSSDVEDFTYPLSFDLTSPHILLISSKAFISLLIK